MGVSPDLLNVASAHDVGGVIIVHRHLITYKTAD